MRQLIDIRAGKLIIAILFLISMPGVPDLAQAKYRDKSDELPGTVSTGTIILIGAVAVAGVVAIYFIAKSGKKKEKVDEPGEGTPQQADSLNHSSLLKSEKDEQEITLHKYQRKLVVTPTFSLSPAQSFSPPAFKSGSAGKEISLAVGVQFNF